MKIDEDTMSFRHSRLKTVTCNVVLRVLDEESVGHMLDRETLTLHYRYTYEYHHAVGITVPKCQRH